MSFWSWITGRESCKKLPEMIWLADAMATQQCVEAVRKRMCDNAIVMIVAHFPQRIEQLKTGLEAAGIVHQEIREPLGAQRITSIAGNRDKQSPLLVSANLLQPGERSRVVVDDRSSVTVFVREHHPLRSEDEKIENFVASIPWHSQLQYFTSLEDPLLAAFAGAQVSEALKRMGMKPEEAIESKMVGRRIKAAQHKLEREAFGYNPEARSSLEWFERLPHANRPAGPWDEKYFPKN